MKIPEAAVKVLVVGGGGREHALCWKLAKSNHVAHVFCAPGNGGTAGEKKVTNIEIRVSEFEKLGRFCQENEIALVVIGPDNPLADGIVDALQALGLRVFGPRQASARLESSKSFAKEFMEKHDIPTARHVACNNLADALTTAEKQTWARVVKADGLALGKGVFVCDNEAEVKRALNTVLGEKAFGEAGDVVLLEERLTGEELSLLYFCDGKRLVSMPSCQDHKRRFDGDTGPNTGGMGAYSPVALYERCKDRIDQTIRQPIESALASGDLEYCGVLYVGLIVTADNQPYVLEFNARFGDPETQALMPLMESDLFEALWACTEGSLDEVAVRWSGKASCCVVAATEQYPAGSSRGEQIAVKPLPEHAFIFHGGTKMREDGKVVTDGGRVLAVAAVAPDMESAQNLAYDAINAVQFAGIAYRTDIARRALKPCVSS